MSPVDRDDVIEDLHRIARIEPSSEDVQRAMDRTRDALRAPRRARRPRRAFRIVLPAGLAAAAALLIVVLWPGHGGNGIVWARVLEKIRTARTVHLRQTIYRPPSQAADAEPAITDVDMYLQTPDKLRQEFRHPKLGRVVTICDARRRVTLVPSRKLYNVRPNTMFTAAHMQNLLAFLCPGVPVPDDPEERFARFVDREDSRDKLVLLGVQERDGKRLRKYRLEQLRDEDQERRTEEKDRQLYWFDDRTSDLLLITRERLIDSRWTEDNTAWLELNVDFPRDTFSLDVPAGYRSVPPVAVAPGMPEELLDIAEAYHRARQGIQRYRFLLWARTGKDPRPPHLELRAMRDGPRWRIDRVRARFEGKLIEPGPDFNALWAKADVASVGRTVLTCNGRPAQINRNRDEGDPRQVLTQWDYGSSESDYELAELGWPEWPDDDNYFVAEPVMLYQRLPDRPDRPGLIGVRVESNYPARPGIEQYMHDYWLDPARDHLCVRRETHQREGARPPWRDNLNWHPTEPTGDPKNRPNTAGEYDRVTEIVEFGQTPEGRWYPRTFRDTTAYIADEKSYPFAPRFEYIQLDTTGPIPSELLDWPADLPRPE